MKARGSLANDGTIAIFGLVHQYGLPGKVHDDMRVSLALVLSVLTAPAAFAAELGAPVQCNLGVDCFVQQFPDMDASGGVIDPFCGIASNDTHDGTDFRILSMVDVQRGVPVVAVGDGKVLRQRDGVPDRLVTSEADRAAIGNQECGNGLILDLGGGLEAQYCHLRQGSLAVKPGQSVKRGDKLGEVGASGLAQFPHIHLTIRREGKPVDPSTGQALDAGCLRDAARADPLFAAEVAEKIGHGETQLLASGFAAGPVDHDALTVSGPPPAADATSANFVGWSWFVNLRQGDQVRTVLAGAGDAVIAESTTDPMDRAKASYSAFAGKRGAPKPGDYKLTVSVIRNGAAVVESEKLMTIR
jgi:hypothetical protein